jgi:FkbM family methyltransferase
MFHTVNSLKYILRHPLNSSTKWEALNRYLRWQVSSRLALGPTIVPFVNGSCLTVSHGMLGATQNVYTGLHEFEDCGLLLHLLRPQDLCIDIGANVGVYTVLSSAAIGARTISIEPIPSTYSKLVANILCNNVSARVTSYNIGLGRENDTLVFTSDRDAGNHVVPKGTRDGNTIEVPVRPLDDVVGDESPAIIKMDVEGWESEVLAGAEATLKKQSLLCLIVEMNGDDDAFNPNEKAVHDCLLRHHFAPYAYEPISRKLMPLQSKHVGASNTVYLRNLEEVKKRVKTADPFRVNGRAI